MLVQAVASVATLIRFGKLSLGCLPIYYGRESPWIRYLYGDEENERR
jgi:hypothetical protein